MTTMGNHNQPLHQAIARQTGDMAGPQLAAKQDWSKLASATHVVQFYEADSFLVETVCEFIADGLRAGEAGLVVATAAHRAALSEELGAALPDFNEACAAGQCVMLDAAELLSTFMVGGLPDAERFQQVVGGLVLDLARQRPRVRIFGEMVALLWAEQNHNTALRLEELWNQLQQALPFALFCAYPVHGCAGDELVAPLAHMCAEHSLVIPAESYSALREPHDRDQAIVVLQHKASLLEAEIEERKLAEAELLAVKDSLALQIEDLRQLHEMSARLTQTLEIEEVLQEVLQAALVVHRTELGLLSLCDRQRDGLKLTVQRGFDAAFLAAVDHVPPGGGACGTCYQERRRVVVEDVETDPIFAPYREAARRAGFRSCHSTPLITRSGRIVGVLSVHFRGPRRASEREGRLMELYAQTAADFIENAQLHQQVQQELAEREQLLLREHAARAEAERANHVKDDFLATISHELRTPLTSIIGWAERLRRRKLDEETVARGLDVIARCAKSQAQIIEDILDVSRVITGKLKLEIRPVDAATIISAAVETVQLAVESKNIQLAVLIDPRVPPLLGDAGRLQQVIWNLLSNAIKFTPADGRVEVRLERAGAFAQIKVCDTGEGIQPEFLPFIFERFTQADSSTTRRHGGIGLGLAIVRHLVELHGGTVRADSPGANKGTTMTISLPIAGQDTLRAVAA